MLIYEDIEVYEKYHVFLISYTILYDKKAWEDPAHVRNETKSNYRLNLRFTKIGEKFWAGIKKSGKMFGRGIQKSGKIFGRVLKSRGKI